MAIAHSSWSRATNYEKEEAVEKGDGDERKKKSVYEKKRERWLEEAIYFTASNPRWTQSTFFSPYI